MNLKTSQVTLCSIMFPKPISFEGNTACSNCSIIIKKRKGPATTSSAQVIVAGKEINYLKSTCTWD